VIAKTGKLAGIFTDGDLRRLLIRHSDLLDRPVSTVMGKNPKVIPPTASVREALDLITQLQVDQLLVVGDSGGPEGLVDIQDLAGFLRGEPVIRSNG
jgi:arabinose-5-phosphate isomerase